MTAVLHTPNTVLRPASGKIQLLEVSVSIPIGNANKYCTYRLAFLFVRPRNTRKAYAYIRIELTPDIRGHFHCTLTADHPILRYGIITDAEDIGLRIIRIADHSALKDFTGARDGCQL